MGLAVVVNDPGADRERYPAASRLIIGYDGRGQPQRKPADFVT
jgi:hypothetical protein